MRFKNVKDKQELIFIKYLAFVYAVLIMGIAFGVGLLSGVIEAGMLANSATTGPLVGAFLLAMLVPMANAKVCMIADARRFRSPDFPDFIRAFRCREPSPAC